jgi:hypothetical protein
LPENKPGKQVWLSLRVFFPLLRLRGRWPFLLRKAKAFALFSVFVLRTKAFAFRSSFLPRKAPPPVISTKPAQRARGEIPS